MKMCREARRFVTPRIEDGPAPFLTGADGFNVLTFRRYS